MLDREQFLLSKIGEEANEIGQRAMKAQQFGLKETQEGVDKHGKPYGTNEERMVSEFYDLLSLMNRMKKEGFLHWSLEDWKEQDKEKEGRADRGLALARATGKVAV